MAQTQEEVIDLIRVSTAEQAEGGVERQRMVNKAARTRRGQMLRREIVVIDVSGRHVQADPSFQALFKELEDPTLAGVQVAEQSRIFRPEFWSDYAILDYFSKNKKLIFTPDSRIDPCTPEGRVTLTLGGMMSGEELIRIRDRCNGGKEKLRLEGKHAGGKHLLPRGVLYIRERDADGRVIKGKGRWEHDGVDSVRVMRAYELLFENVSQEEIARQIGGGWTGSGIRNSLRNPIWKGQRIYAYRAIGKEYTPKPTPENPNPKPRRESKRIAEPTLVAIDLPPLISPEAWERAQEILAKRTTRWRHSKKKNSTRPRFLAGGVARCSCGKPLYGTYGSANRFYLDAYSCSSRIKGRPGCGLEPVKRADMDLAIQEIMTEKLCDPRFLLQVWETAQSAHAALPDPGRSKREAALAKLSKGRAALLALVRTGDLTQAEFRAEIAVLDAEVQQLTAMLPEPMPALDPQELIGMLASTFARFGMLPFEAQRDLLRGAITEITLEGRSIPSVMVSGGYLGVSAKSLSRCTTQLGIRAIPDFTIRFPQPIAIPDTYIDGRGPGLRRRKAA